MEELQTDHEWCEKMNEAVEKSFIPIPKIDLSKPINNMHLKMLTTSHMVGGKKVKFEYNQPITFIKKTETTSVTLNQHNIIIFAIKYAQRLIFGANYIAKCPSNMPSNLTCKISGTDTGLHCLVDLKNCEFYYALLNCSDFKYNTDNTFMTNSMHDYNLNDLRSHAQIIEIGLSKNITYSEQTFNLIFSGANAQSLTQLSDFVTSVSEDNIIFYRSSWAAYDLKMFILPE